MGLDFAIDELYATGWQTLDSTGCGCTPEGRLFPGVDRITQEFARSGFTLSLRRMDPFDCTRAEWADSSGRTAGGVVGSHPEEAAVYALAHLRRQTVLQAVGTP